MKALIALEDGTVFEGRSAGIEGEQEGEIVFNTSMTGYQEIITDPSYKGQIVTMTYPLIGNYGVNDEDVESKGPKVRGFRCQGVQQDHQQLQGKGGSPRLSRATQDHGHRRGRYEGAHQAPPGEGRHEGHDLHERPRPGEPGPQRPGNRQGIVGIDLVKEVTCEAPYVFDGEEGLFRRPTSVT